MAGNHFVIGIVGPSKSGKSTLKKGLEEKGYQVRHIAQEHSFAPAMWKIIANPDVLIFLDVAFDQTLIRGQPSWIMADFQKEIKRLGHARENADLYIPTMEISSKQVLNQVLNFIDHLGE